MLWLFRNGFNTFNTTLEHGCLILFFKWHWKYFESALLTCSAQEIAIYAQRCSYRHYIRVTWQNILRKTIEGHLDSVQSLTFNTIKTELIMQAFHSSRYLQSKWMFDLSHASMIKVKSMYMSKWCNPLYVRVTSIQNWWKSFLLFVFHNGWLKNHCWLSGKRLTPNFVGFFYKCFTSNLLSYWLGMPYLYIFVKEVVTLLGAITDKWVWTLVCGQN